MKIVLIFRLSVKVVKAKSAKVQGCARVSPAREKTTAVRMPLGRHAMSCPQMSVQGGNFCPFVLTQSKNSEEGGGAMPVCL